MRRMPIGNQEKAEDVTILVLGAGEPVMDYEERKIMEAFQDRSWDFRTVDGLARQTGLSPQKVRVVLERNAAKIRKSPAVDKNGQALFTLSSKPISWRERLSFARAVLARSVR
jgi:hypothetical protein